MTGTWSIYDDNGPLEDIESQSLSEEDARKYLSQYPRDQAVYATNAAGDFIESHDGPVVIGRTRSE